MFGLDALRITSYSFAFLLCLKLLLYVGIGRRIYRLLGRSRVKLFWRHYAHGKHLMAAAWRLGAFASLLISYLGLLLYARGRSLDAPLDTREPSFWCWLVLLVFLIGRTVLQSLVEWRDLDESLQSLLRTLKIKAGLRHVGRAVTVLGLIYPVVSLQGWAAAALWSKRALILGKGVALFEHWFDRRVHGELRQFVITSVAAAILETLLKILIISLAILQARNL